MSFFKDDILAVNGFNEDFEGWGREDSELAVRFYNYGLKRKEQNIHLWPYVTTSGTLNLQETV